MKNTFVTTVLALILVTTSACGQQVVLDDSGMAPVPRLTVRPHEMATGTQTTQAGLTALAGFPEYLVYVPKQCVGSQRVPLMVLLHGGGRSSKIEIDKFRTLADKYGVIVLLPNASNPGRWEMVYGGLAHNSPTESGLKVSKLPMHDVQSIDSAMKIVLRTHAIDPDRIALLGFSDGGSSSLLLGRSNLDVFNRIAPLSALIDFDGIGPANATTQFYLSGGIDEGMVPQTLKMAQVLRHEGHPVATLLGLRGHVDRVQDEDFVWKWLLYSWKDPSITLHPTIPPDANDVLLTSDALQKMTDFWTRFKQEQSDSILKAGRMAHQEQYWMWLGAEPVTVIATDMPTLAAAYPRVADDLKAAGLTAEQEAAYRMAILRVGFARAGSIAPGDTVEPPDLGQHIPFEPISPASKLGKNLAFRQAHDAEFKALEATDMWTIQ